MRNKIHCVLGGILFLVILSSCADQARLEKLEKENRELIAKVARLEFENQQLKAGTRVQPTFPPTPSPVVSTTPAVSNTLIVPGVSLGRVELGKPVPQSFLNYMGPSKRDESVSPNVYLWTGRLLLKTRIEGGQKRVEAMYIYDPKFKTDKKVGVGGPLKAAQQLYPAGQWREGIDDELCWDTLNIDFCSQDKQTISNIFMGDVGS